MAENAVSDEIILVREFHERRGPWEIPIPKPLNEISGFSFEARWLGSLFQTSNLQILSKGDACWIDIKASNGCYFTYVVIGIVIPVEQMSQYWIVSIEMKFAYMWHKKDPLIPAQSGGWACFMTHLIRFYFMSDKYDIPCKVGCDVHGPIQGRPRRLSARISLCQAIQLDSIQLHAC